YKISKVCGLWVFFGLGRVVWFGLGIVGMLLGVALLFLGGVFLVVGGVCLVLVFWGVLLWFWCGFSCVC
ncbi:hypothetical protein ABVB60_18420, partial [Vibrio cholerae]